MLQPRSSRQLSGRVEIEFHKKPNRFKRRVWWTALWLSLLAGAWMFYETAQGNTPIYQAGDISTPHAMFEQDCAKCHSLDTDIINVSSEQRAKLTDGRWAPVRRLFGVFGGSENSPHSVSNANCEACHAGTVHHENQFPLHGDGVDDLSCAVCHREHEGNKALGWVTNQQCIACHGNLTDHVTDGSDAFAPGVTDFGLPDGHPVFKIEQLLKEQPPVSEAKRDAGTAHKAFDVVDYAALDGEPAKWRDTARIRFNHAAHLQAMYPDGKERLRGGQADRTDGIKRRQGDAAGQLIGYPMSCADCHEYDEAGAYIKPIVFEKHCQECHPLNVTVTQYTADNPAGTKRSVTVPHEQPGVVRGYLALAFHGQTPAGLLTDAANGANLTDGEKQKRQAALDALQRGFPGQNFAQTMNAAVAKEIQAELAKLDRELGPLEYVQTEVAKRKGEQVLFKENGSCALCHDVQRAESPDSAGTEFADWKITPPRIPERWLKHSRFKHDTHRMLSCAHCHSDLASGRPIQESRSTGDVLMPSTESCRECHGQSAQSTSGLARPARSDCVECHNYHSHQNEDYDGTLTLDLLLQKAGKAESSGEDGTK